jgi:hypothetical protein
MRLPTGLLALLFTLVSCGPPTGVSTLVAFPTPRAVPVAEELPGVASWSVLTSHNDLARTGQNLHELELTPRTVDPAHFGKLAALPVDGAIYGQPLVVLGLASLDGGVSDLLYAATAHDSVYAFSAVAPFELRWQRSLLGPGATPVPSQDVGSNDIFPEIGITGTPVIDASSRTIYLVAKSKEPGPRYVERLHALDLETGAERDGSPVEISATVRGSAPDADDAGVHFNALRQLQRPGLTLSGGLVWVAFGSHGDVEPYHGWVLGYDAHTLARRVVFNTTPDGSEGSVWQGGGALAVDDDGSLYLETANGDFDADVGGRDVGDAVVKLSQTGQRLDWFAPHDQLDLASRDLDLGSSGPMLLPEQPGEHPHLMIAGGKNGLLYLLDRDSLGEYQADADTQIVQSLLIGRAVDAPRYGLYSTAAWWNGRVYLTAANGPMQAWVMEEGRLQPRHLQRARRVRAAPHAVTPCCSQSVESHADHPERSSSNGQRTRGMVTDEVSAFGYFKQGSFLGDRLPLRPAPGDRDLLLG